MHEDQTSPEDATVSSASLCMSPKAEDPRPIPLCASTPLVKSTYNQNGVDQVDNKKCDANSNYEEPTKTDGNVSMVLEARNSVVDVLSGAESDTCDTFSRTRRNNNNSIQSTFEGIGKAVRNNRRDAEDIYFCVAKELLMTERTYKRDLELITVSWSGRVSELAAEGEPPDIVEAFGRPCLALEPIALRQGAFLATLERCLADVNKTDTEDKEPEYKKIGDMLLDYLISSYDEYAWYMSRAGGLLALVESARRTCPRAAPPSTAVHAPLRRPHHYLLLADVLHENGEPVIELRRTCAELFASATAELRHVENHATLCQLQRDLTGYDKLLVPDRQFVQLGCLYKHSSKGLQQRMIFLFSDIMVVASKPGLSAQFRAISVWTLQDMKLERADLPNSFTLHNDEMSMLLSASNELEFLGWLDVLRDTIDNAPRTDNIDLTVDHSDIASPSSSSPGVALAHVCWHRACSLHATHLHTVLCTELSGYLLRKFKSSHGWQKLWVVLSTCTLHFYKSWLDAEPLASLPMLGYSVGVPSEQDSINKDYVFKLQHKGHVYFFRADCQYTYNRWTDTLRKATTSPATLRT